MQAALARAEQARVVYQSQIDGVHTSVARLRAELRDAEYNLQLTTVRAPGPGFVTQLALRPGMFVVPAPFRPAMVFVHHDDRALAAGFQQNALQRVRAGDEAEVAFDAVPGRVFKGKVARVLDAIATGQLQAAGSLQDMESLRRVDERLRSSICMKTSRPTTFLAGQPRRWQSIRHTPITSPSSGAFCCACGAGRTMCSWRAFAVREKRALRRSGQRSRRKSGEAALYLEAARPPGAATPADPSARSITGTVFNHPLNVRCHFCFANCVAASQFSWHRSCPRIPRQGERLGLRNTQK